MNPKRGNKRKDRERRLLGPLNTKGPEISERKYENKITVRYVDLGSSMSPAMVATGPARHHLPLNDGLSRSNKFFFFDVGCRSPRRVSRLLRRVSRHASGRRGILLRRRGGGGGGGVESVDGVGPGIVHVMQARDLGAVICSQHRRKKLVSARETVAEGERRKRRKRRERERERMKRESSERENENVDTTWQPQTGHKKRSCQNLDLKGKVVPL